MTTGSPLKGIRVLEWTSAIAGPWGSKFLADFGAEVIRVESSQFVAVDRTMAPFKDGIPTPDNCYPFLLFNTGKRSITLDLTKPRGVELFKRLVEWADIISQNHRPGIMRRIGLDYDELKKIKEDIIMINVSSTGHEGPYSQAAAWGNSSIAMSGQTYLQRSPGNPPSQPGFNVTGDAIGAIFVGIAAVSALDYKRRTGKGQCISVSLTDPMIQFVAPGILDYVVNERIQQPIGNRDPDFAPHGVYRCKGDDEWCAIAVTTDEEWSNFCRVLGNPQWTKEPEFATFALRKQNEDKLDRLIELWTINYPPREVMERMQRGGVPAGELQNVDDILYRDPQVRDRALFPRLSHHVLGEVRHNRSPFILSRTPDQIRTGPCVGEANNIRRY
jgi:benzylsuccinate CoA-transferase BbsF subunit